MRKPSLYDCSRCKYFFARDFNRFESCSYTDRAHDAEAHNADCFAERVWRNWNQQADIIVAPDWYGKLADNALTKFREPFDPYRKIQTRIDRYRLYVVHWYVSKLYAMRDSYFVNAFDLFVLSDEG